MSLNYVTQERTIMPSKVYSDPYMRAEIEQIDHNHTIHQSLSTWTRQYPCETKIWDGTKMLWLNPRSSHDTTYLTRNINIASEGWYRTYIKVRRGPTNKGKLRYYINSDLIDKPVEAYHKNFHWKMVDLGLTYLNTGKNILRLNLEPNVPVGTIFLYKIVKHDSFNITDYAHKLDIQNLQFTQNSVNDLNTLEMPITLKDEYYDDNSPSRFVFDGYTNAITLWMGEEKQDATAMFGGYITKLKDSKDDILTISAADRLLDFYREPIYLNFEINTSVKADDSKLFPYVHKHNIHEVVRYIAETNEEGINTSGVESPYVFYWDFSDLKEFNKFQVSKYTKKWDTNIGNPKPCLRLGVGKRSGSAKAILWDNPENPFDANIDNIFSFSYFYSSKSAKYPTEMHFEIDMYRDDDPTTLKVYNILFNSKEGSLNVIGHVKPSYNGIWNTVKFDLRKAFDDYVPASQYNITGMRIVDSLSTSQVKNRLNSGIWLDNITVYDESQNVKTTIDQEGAYPFEIFKNICEDTDYSIYVDYGNSRREDILVLRSNYDSISEVSALTSNKIEIGDVTYDMYGSNVRNTARRMYHPVISKKKAVAHTVKHKPKKKKYKVTYVKTKSGKKVKRYVYYTYKNVKIALNRSDEDKIESSYKRYRKWEDFKDLTDVTSGVDADLDAENFLNEHNQAPYGFPLTMNGTTLLKPNQYLYVEEDKRHLTGLHQIKDIIHNYDASKANKWQTQIDLGLPSKRFKILAKRMTEDIKRLNNRHSNVIYTTEQLNNLGNTSPGAFIG
jgi:hypothetical protein